MFKPIDELQNEINRMGKNWQELKNVILELIEYVDGLKDIIKELGYEVEKTPEGFRYKKID